MGTVLRRLFYTLGMLVALVAGLLVVAWGWSGSDGSLARALQLLANQLPAGSTLQATDTQGALRHGGQIGRLHIQAAGWEIEARDVRLRWQPLALWQQRLQIDELAASHVSLRQVASTPAGAPPTALELPLAMSATVSVGTLTMAGPTTLQASALAARYEYDRTTHRLQLDNIRWADGRYRGQASLGAQAPLALSVQLAADVSTPIPGTRRSVALTAQARLAGHLQGSEGLHLNGQIEPAERAGGSRAELSARLQPWAAQPVQQASARFEHIDLGAWWPGAPRTQLGGQFSVTPAAPDTWGLTAQVRNNVAGPWDRDRLPLDTLELRARVTQAVTLEVQVDHLEARAVGGRWTASGRWRNTGEAPWQGEARADGVNPAALLTTLAPATLDGRLQARASGLGVQFDIALSPSARQTVTAPALAGLRLKLLRSRGQYSAGVLDLAELRLEAGDTLLTGRARLRPATRDGQATLDLQGPGLRARVDGSVGPATGAGTASVQIDDAARAQRALAPLLALWGSTALPTLTGNASLQGEWQGGWRDPSALRVVARLSVPRLSLRDGAPGSEAIQLREVSAQVNGPLSTLALQLQGQMQRAAVLAQLDATGQAGYPGSGRWLGRVDKLAVQLQDGADAPRWALRLAAPVTLRHSRDATGELTELSAGEAQLSGPATGTATLAWQPLRASLRNGQRTLDSEGQLRGLPLAWLAQATGALQDMGLSGDLLFDGAWSVRLAEQLRVQATLARRSGDLRLLAGDGAGQLITAGIREARLAVSSEGEALRATLAWDSQHAGQVSAELTTRLAREGGAWGWPGSAPLAGQLKASLPRVAAWSVLAPPGWRMHGTLDANATISGTRAQPQWAGELRADELAVRAVLEGIELDNGRLRTRFSGSRLDIDEFSLRGAGPTGGSLKASGFAQWLPATGAGAGHAAGLGRVRMALAARADGLRVGNRADRRLAVSGDLHADLENAKLSVRGALKADQARFALPDEETPSLGSDVVVRGANRSGPRGTTATPAPTRNAQVMPDMAVTLDLGNDFQIEGRGLRSRLTGSLVLTLAGGTPRATPRLTGDVRTAGGTFRAYQQQLAIERGLLRFTGAFDNPTLDILAIRPNLPQRAGVQVTGTALSPRIRLYSDPALSDADTLAWLVLGRAAAAGAAESAVLQQALVAVVGGGIPSPTGALARLFGLDEVSVGGATGEDGSTGAAVTVGKRIARNFYVTYERSLAGTIGTLYIFYDLSRRLTLRAQAGEQSAVDLIFTLPYE